MVDRETVLLEWIDYTGILLEYRKKNPWNVGITYDLSIILVIILQNDVFLRGNDRTQFQ